MCDLLDDIIVWLHFCFGITGYNKEVNKSPSFLKCNVSI